MSILSWLWRSSAQSIVQSAVRGLRRLGSGPRWVVIQSGPLAGRELYLDLRYESWSSMHRGDYDSFLYEALESSGPVRDATFWDIGAHFGYHSLAFARLAGPKGRVIAFEPNPSNIQRFQMHLDRNPMLATTIALEEMALSQHEGTSEFVTSMGIDNGRSSGGHLAGAVPPLSPNDYRGFARTSVKTASIDSLIAQRRIPPADVIKIDVEGAELSVLRGAFNFLSQHRPTILMEVHNILMMHACQEFLQGLQYDLQVLDEAHATPSRCFVIARRLPHTT